jgi:colanic acid biosynthesis glycosyl transferase WcaI
MRILIYGMNYAPELIGIGRYTGELGRWLASRGHAVTVLAAPPYYPQWRVADDYRPQRWLRERLSGVEVLRAPLYVPHRVTGKGRLLQELSFGISSLRWWADLWQRRWDAVLTICPPLQSGLIPVWLARRQRIPFIYHIQDFQLDAARELGILRWSPFFALFARLERFCLAQADVVTTISQAMAARLRDKGTLGEKVRVLPNWADLDSIQPGSRNNPLRQEMGLNTEVIVLYAGNLGEKQGLETVLEAAALTRRNPKICYVLAGEGAVKTRLMALAQQQGLGNLHFLPLQSNKRFPLLLAAADIHLVIQRRKASDLLMPSKLANILAAGRPFIATALPETELGRVTLASGAGALVAPEEPRDLARAILKLTADDNEREMMGKRARSYAEAELGRDNILAQWEQLLARLPVKIA